MINTNLWNKIRYSVYRPFYDPVGRYFTPYRKQSIQSLNLNPNDKILIVGAGTGLDLEFLQGFKHITAIDITQSMIHQLKQRAHQLRLPVTALVMDGSHLEFEDASFDAVILHLIVAVIPDAVGCIKETERVLKPGGKFTIMDKFLPPGTSPSLLRRLINPFSNILATNLNRNIDELLAHSNLIKQRHEKLDALFWLVQGHKPIKE